MLEQSSARNICDHRYRSRSAGSAMLVSLVLAAIVSLFTALSFAELSARLPQDGGAYEFAYHLVSP